MKILYISTTLIFIGCGGSTTTELAGGGNSAVGGSTSVGGEYAAGGTTTSISGANSGGGAVAQTGGATSNFVCGDATCEPSQICLYPAYGCVAFTLPDSGICPHGTEYSEASGVCVQSPPPPSCVTLASGSGSFDCSGQGDATCSTVSVPIPSHCGRICRAICF